MGGGAGEEGGLMTAGKYACALCNGALQSPNEVCKGCDTVLERSPFFVVDSPTTEHFYHAGGQCPACKQSSKRFEISRYPKNARWYMPEKELPLCTHCKSVLREKYAPDFKWVYGIFLIMFMGLSLLFSKELRNLWQIFVAGLMLCYVFILRYRAYRDPEKYIVLEKQA